jgi:hypothetical protein
MAEVMRTGYLKYRCKLCGEIYMEEFCKDVIDSAWHGFAARESDVPHLHSCGVKQTGFAELVGYIVCEQGKGW